MGKNDLYYVLAYYKLVTIDNPQREVELHKEFLQERDVKARVYISKQGINGQLSATPEAAREYIEWTRQSEYFNDINFKIHHYHEHVFPRLTIKYRKQLVALNCPVDLSRRGTSVPPEKWREMLESGEYLILDVRNQYEWQVGHFKGSQSTGCQNFSDFAEYAENFAATHPPQETKVMMYCTGGIRCEPFSALLKEKGYEQVYQLDGGVIQYGFDEGDKHWKGKLFVFDDRLCVPLDPDKEPDPIGECEHCQETTDQYYNCANIDCDRLFLSCRECRIEMDGCCQESCRHAQVVRPFDPDSAKPFRKWYHYYDDKEKMRKG